MLQRGTTKWHCVNDKNLNQFACEKQRSPLAEGTKYEMNVIFSEQKERLGQTGDRMNRKIETFSVHVTFMAIII